MTARFINAIPELKGTLVGIDLFLRLRLVRSLRNRELFEGARPSRDEAIAAIVRGFHRFDIEGFPLSYG